MEEQYYNNEIITTPIKHKVEFTYDSPIIPISP